MALDPKTKETVREEALRLSKEFAALDGRRPRVLLIEMENDLESDREERKLAARADVYKRRVEPSLPRAAAAGGCCQGGSRQ